MNGVNQTVYEQIPASRQNVKRTGEKEETRAAAGAQDGKKEVKGAGTYGNPKLSQKALDYYNSLKKKYGNMNFILVSSDKKEEAEMLKGSFARAGSLTVLIDTDKVEQMAEDEKYRAQMEGVINNAAVGVARLGEQLKQKNTGAVAFGMSVQKKGIVSFFAVIDKSLAAQKSRLKKKAQEKKDAKKAEQKKAAKEEAKERLEEKRKGVGKEDEDTITIEADSIEELLRKIEEYQMGLLSDSVMTEEEKAVGTKFDFSL